jgi:hypothetical protein
MLYASELGKRTDPARFAAEDLPEDIPAPVAEILAHRIGGPYRSRPCRRSGRGLSRSAGQSSLGSAAAGSPERPGRRRSTPRSRPAGLHPADHDPGGLPGGRGAAIAALATGGGDAVWGDWRVGILWRALDPSSRVPPCSAASPLQSGARLVSGPGPARSFRCAAPGADRHGHLFCPRLRRPQLRCRPHGRLAVLSA